MTILEMAKKTIKETTKVTAEENKRCLRYLQKL